MSATLVIILGITFIYFSRSILQLLIYILRINNATLFNKIYDFSTIFYRIVHTYTTLIHELGHIVVVILVGFKPQSIKLNINTSGSAHYTKPQNANLRSAMVSFAGYTSASIFAVILAVLTQLYTPIYVFSFLTIVVGLSLLFLIRNLYGVIWSIGYLALSGYLLYTGNTYWQSVMITSLCYAVMLGSLISSFNVYLVAKTTDSSDTGVDTVGLEYYTGVTRTFWGISFILISIVCSYLTARVLLGDDIEKFNLVIPLLKGYLFM